MLQPHLDVSCAVKAPGLVALVPQDRLEGGDHVAVVIDDEDAQMSSDYGTGLCGGDGLPQSLCHVAHCVHTPCARKSPALEARRRRSATSGMPSNPQTVRCGALAPAHTRTSKKPATYQGPLSTRLLDRQRDYFWMVAEPGDLTPGASRPV